MTSGSERPSAPRGGTTNGPAAGGAVSTPGDTVSGPFRPDASMSLLNDVVRNPLEPDYAEAAARGRPVRNGPLWLLLAVVIGVATTAAVLALRAPQPGATEARVLLQEEILARTEQSDQLRAETQELDAEISELQVAAAATGDPRLLAELAADEVPAALAAVTGPGIVVTLVDGPAANGTPPDPEARVQAIDLQVLVNGLWAAGAEAVAINGHRLTALSAIRGAGEAVLVDLAPLVPPYTVAAIGDARGLQTEIARTAAGRHLALLQSTYGIGSEVKVSEDLQLAGAPAPSLRFASVPEQDPSPAREPVPGTDVSGQDVPGQDEDARAAADASGTEDGGRGVAR